MQAMAVNWLGPAVEHDTTTVSEPGVELFPGTQGAKTYCPGPGSRHEATW